MSDDYQAGDFVWYEGELIRVLEVNGKRLHLADSVSPQLWVSNWKVGPLEPGDLDIDFGDSEEGDTP
jgi:hypothetical protein